MSANDNDGLTAKSAKDAKAGAAGGTAERQQQREGFGRPRVEIFTRAGCPRCAEAKERLGAAGIAFGEYKCDAEVEEGPENLAELVNRDVALSFPAIFVDGKVVSLEEAVQKSGGKSC